jgi:hypothetical protein
MKNMFKMAISDQNCSLMKVNFERFFTDAKIAIFWAILFYLKIAVDHKSRVIGENTPNLVTLIIFRNC